jgi:hypothetical protein
LRRAPLIRLLGGVLALGAMPALAADRPRASARDLPLELDWTAPPECPTADEVRAELALATRVRAGSQPVLRARAIITREGDEYVLSLTTLRDGDRREKQGRAPDCATLQHMATLILGLALGESVDFALEGAEPAPNPAEGRPTESGRAGEPEEPSSDRARSSEPVSEGSARAVSQVEPPEPERSGFPEPDLDQARSSEPSRTSRPSWVAFGGLSSSFGLLPEPAIGPALGAGFVPESRLVPSAALSVAMLWPIAPTDVRADVTARFSVIAARVAGCWASSGPRPTLAVCPLSLSGGALFAASDGAERDESVVAPWYAWTPSVRVGLEFSERSRIRLEPMAVFSPFRTEFRIEGVGVVHTVPFWAVGLELGLELELASGALRE